MFANISVVQKKKKKKKNCLIELNWIETMRFGWSEECLFKLLNVLEQIEQVIDKTGATSKESKVEGKSTKVKWITSSIWTDDKWWRDKK